MLLVTKISDNVESMQAQFMRVIHRRPFLTGKSRVIARAIKETGKLKKAGEIICTNVFNESIYLS